MPRKQLSKNWEKDSHETQDSRIEIAKSAIEEKAEAPSRSTIRAENKSQDTFDALRLESTSPSAAAVALSLHSLGLSLKELAHGLAAIWFVFFPPSSL